MTWQQLLVAIWLMVCVVVTTYRSADRGESSGTVAWTFVLTTAEVIAVAFLLSSGGFW